MVKSRIYVVPSVSTFSVYTFFNTGLGLLFLYFLVGVGS